MKTITYILLFLLSINVAWAKAVIIRFNFLNTSSALIEMTKTAVDNGIIGYWQNTIKENLNATDSYSTQFCLEQSTQASPEQFDEVVAQLKQSLDKIPVKKYYQLKDIEQCSKTINQCVNNEKLCSSSVFIGNQGYNDYLARSQVAAGFAEITPVKTILEALINEGVNVKNAEQIGLDAIKNCNQIGSITNPTTGLPILTCLSSNQNESRPSRCSQIDVNSNATTGEAMVSCLLQGHIAIAGKTLTWTRIPLAGTEDFTWQCTTDFSPEDKLKYAGICGN